MTAECTTDTPGTHHPCCPQGVGTSACWDRAYETGQEDLRTEIYRVLDKGFEGHAIPVCEAQDAMASTPSQLPEIPKDMQKEFVQMIQDPEQRWPLRNLIEALDDCNAFMREQLIRLMQDPEHRGVLRDLIVAVDAPHATGTNPRPLDLHRAVARDIIPAPLTWTLRILSGISEGICNTMVQSGGEFLYIGVGGR